MSSDVKWQLDPPKRSSTAGLVAGEHSRHYHLMWIYCEYIVNISIYTLYTLYYSNAYNGYDFPEDVNQQSGASIWSINKSGGWIKKSTPDKKTHSWNLLFCNAFFTNYLRGATENPATHQAEWGRMPYGKDQHVVVHRAQGQEQTLHMVAFTLLGPTRLGMPEFWSSRVNGQHPKDTHVHICTYIYNINYICCSYALDVSFFNAWNSK